jgi:CRP-like cAMP-binding protein
VPFFAPLSPSTLETIARRAERVRVPAGRPVFAQGDEGDHFFVVVDGEVELSVDGRATKTLGARDFFGEIALLRDVPRTGTVTARQEVELLAIARDDFLAAVTGTAEASQAADDIVGARLSAVRPATA